MTDTVTEIFRCPLSKCNWILSSAPRGPFAMASTEAAIKNHLSSHDLTEWVSEVVNLHEVMTSVAAELDEQGRIGRTLLTGSYPAAANLARRECIGRIGRAIKGNTDG